MKRPIRILALSLSILLAACSRPPLPPETRTRVVEAGPLSGASRVAEASLDAQEIGWVTAFRAEAVDESTGAKLDDSVSWRAALRLVNGTRLLAVTSRTPEIRFPQGYAFPLGQVLRDIPEKWRGASIVAEGSPEEGRRVRVRAVLDYLPTSAAGGEAPKVKKLYVLSLPVTEDPSGESAPGPRVVRRSYSYIVPVDATVHFAVAHFHEHAVSIRLTDLKDGKILWQAEGPAPGRPGSAGIPVYRSETGFPVYREHEYEIEVGEDGSARGTGDVMAVLFLYYRPPGDEEFSYPYPPEADEPVAP